MFLDYQGENKMRGHLEIMHDKHAGDLTARVAATLFQEVESKGYYVFSDHSPSKKNVGRITSWYSNLYGLETRLSLIDFAIVDAKQEPNLALALVEIEETNDRPKNFLADAMSILLGDHINFGEDHPLKVGEWTTLIIMGRGPTSHQERNCYLRQKVINLQHHLGTGNASIGQIFIENYSIESELIQILRKRLNPLFKPE
jgi:hypothetical protein